MPAPGDRTPALLLRGFWHGSWCWWLGLDPARSPFLSMPGQVAGIVLDVLP